MDVENRKSLNAFHFKLWLFFVLLSFAFYFLGFKEDFKYSNVKFSFYYHFWISLDLLIPSLTFLWCINYLENKAKIHIFDSLKHSIIFFILADFIVGLHNGYCEICSNLGLCGSLHNYPNSIMLITIIGCFLAISYIKLREQKKIVYFKKMIYFWILSFLISIPLMNISLYYLTLPKPISYKDGVFNIQGLIFLNLIIFCWILAYFFYKKTKEKLGYLSLESKIIVLQFIIIGFSQIPAAYHLISCYWCHVEECSEFFGIAGILLETCIYFLGKTYFNIFGY